MDEDGEEAEGEASTATPQAQPPVDSDDDGDDDIEASIEKELAALKAGRGAKGLVKKEAAHAKGKGEAKERPRFQSIQTDTECCAYTSRLPATCSADATARSVLHCNGLAARPRRVDGSHRLRGPGDGSGPHTVRVLA